MSRYVFLFRHADPAEEDIAQIANTPGVTILDHSVGRAILVEAPAPVVNQLRDSLDNWILAEEKSYPQPGPHVEQVTDPTEPTS